MPINQKDIDFLNSFKDDVFFTRDKNSRLFMTIIMPTRNESSGEWESDAEKQENAFFELDKEMLKAVTWESGKVWTPQELLAEAGQ